MVDNQEIKEVISGCIQLKRESQKKLYSNFYGYAMSICMRYTRHDEDAIEIMNDGFLKVFKELPSFVPRYEDVEASLKGWIKPIMVHSAIDHFRKNQRHYNHVCVDDHILYIADHQEDSIDKMSYEELIKLVQNLSPVYRTVFNLYVIDGLSHKEIAKHLKISVGASKSNLAKARMNIQKMILQTEKRSYGKTVN